MSFLFPFCSYQTDFFGPKATECVDFYASTPVEHFILGNQKERVEAINTLARERISCEQWPSWQRRNGSIIYVKLPQHIKKIFKEEYLDKDGFVDLESLQILEKESLIQWAEMNRTLPAVPNPYTRTPVKELVACPALSLRLKIGDDFDMTQHPQILSQKTPLLHMNTGKIPLHRTLREVVEGKKENSEIGAFKQVWDYAVKLPAKEKSDSSDFGSFSMYTLIATLALLILNSKRCIDCFSKSGLFLKRLPGLTIL